MTRVMMWARGRLAGVQAACAPRGGRRPTQLVPCGNCPPKPECAPLDWDPDPGFGMVYLTRDGVRVGVADAWVTVQDFEDRAAGDPDHDWRFEIHGPLDGVVYQRHGEGEWVAVKGLDGFA